jgi:K+-transporting ATPase ATPase C chain
MATVLSEVRVALVMTLSLALVVCVAYPVAVFAAAQAFFPHKANGSLVYHQGAIVGSQLIAQRFEHARYFHPRPSAAGKGYDASASGGSNLGPTSAKLIDSVEKRIAQYRAENGLPETIPIPADAVTASASGLDPHIGIDNALLQARRVAAARGWKAEEVVAEIRAQAEGRTFGLLGEPRVNVLVLNLRLDQREKTARAHNG